MFTHTEVVGPSPTPSQPALNETNGEPLESGKRRMTPTSMTPPPVPKKSKREHSPIRSPSLMDDEPVEPAACTEAKAKEHLAMGLEYPPPEYGLEGKYNRGDEGNGVGVCMNRWSNARMLTCRTPTSVASITKMQGNCCLINSCPAHPGTVIPNTATRSTNCLSTFSRK